MTWVHYVIIFYFLWIGYTVFLYWKMGDIKPVYKIITLVYNIAIIIILTGFVLCFSYYFITGREVSDNMLAWVTFVIPPIAALVFWSWASFMDAKIAEEMEKEDAND